MRGVHRKVEEPPRWTPTLTPIQQRLQRRLSISIYAYFVEYLGGGVLAVIDPSSWVWWVYGTIAAALFAWMLLTVRALSHTGPPFHQVRWRWRWRFPRR